MKMKAAVMAFLSRNADVVEVRSAPDGGLDYWIETAGAIPAMNLAYAIAARDTMMAGADLPVVTASFALQQINEGKLAAGAVASQMERPNA